MVTVFPPAEHDDLSSPRMVSLCFLAAVNNQNLDEKKRRKFSMCARACAAEGSSDLCSREGNTRSAGAVSPGRHFSIFHFCSFKSLHFLICIICMNAMH